MDIAKLGYKVNTNELEKANSLLARLADSFDDIDTDIDTKDLTRLNKELDNTGKSGRRATDSANSMTRSFGGLAAIIPAISFGAIATSAVNLARDFESSMLNVQSKLGITGDAMEALEQQALHLGSTTSFTSKQAGDAMGYLAQAGLNAAGIMEAMPATLNFAAAANIDLAEAADMATNAMGSFGMQTSDLTKITDIMVNASNLSNQSVTELSQAFKVAGGLAANVGVSMGDLAAAAGHLANKGTKGAEAGTALRNMLSILINPAGDAEKALSELSLTSEDFYDKTENGKLIFKGYPSMIDTFTKAGVNASDMMRIFGAENGNAALNMLDGSDAIRELTTGIDKNGTASEAAALKTSGLDGAFKKLSSAWEGAQLKLMDGEGTGMATDGINWLAGAVSALPSILTEVGKYFDAFMGRINELSLGLSDFMTSVSESALGEVATTVSTAARNIGVMGAQGLAEGLRMGKRLITGASQEIAKTVPDAVKSELAIRSPSRVLMEMGVYAGEGLAMGIDKSGGKVSASARKVSEDAAREFDRITEGLTKQYLKMTQGDEAARRYELSMGKMTRSQQETVIATERVIRQLEEEEKRRKETADAVKKAAEEEKRELDRLTAKRESAVEAVQKSKTALELATRSQTESTEQIRAATLELEEGYTPALAAEQAAYESGTEAIKTRISEQKTLADERLRTQRKLEEGTRKLVDQQRLQNVAMTQGATAARELELGMKGYDEQTAKSMVTTEENIALQKDFHGALVDSLTNADSVKDVFQSMGDWMKEWLKEKIIHFAANKIMTYVGIGGSGMPSIMGGGNAGAGGGNMMATLQQGGLGGSLMAGGMGMMAGQMMGQTGIGAGVGSAIGNAIVPVIGGFIGAALGGIVESAFGGEKTKVGEGFQVNYSTEGGLSGQSFDKYEKERSLWRGTRKWKEYSELDGDIEKSVSTYFGNLNEVVNDQARILGFESVENILKGFSVSSVEMGGENAEKQLAAWIEGSTIKAYKMAYDNIDPYIQKAIGNSLEVFGRYAEFSEYLGMTTKEIMDTGKSAGDAYYIFRMLNMGMDATGMTAEEVAERFRFVSDVAMRVTPTIEALGWQIGDSFGEMVYTSTMLTEAIGTTDDMMQRLTYYTNNFVPAAEVAEIVLSNATESLSGWNDTLGLTSEGVIDTREEFRAYIESLDLTTEAGIEAAAAAMEQMEALVLVADANLLTAANLDAVSEATRNLNLNFDATSPLAGAAASSLVDLMGGLEQFTAATKTYYDLFYDENEKQKLGLAQAALAVKDYNDMMGISQDTTIDTREEFRSMVESLDLSTESGRLAYKASMDVAQSMALIADEGKSLDEVIGGLPAELSGAFNLMSSITADSAEQVQQSTERAARALSSTANNIDRLTSSVKSLGSAAAASSNQAASNQASEEVPAYARGGYHSGGLALVGEEGPELVNFGQSANITNHRDTVSLLSGNGGETNELRQLKASIDQMNKDQTRLQRVSIEQRNALLAENEQLKRQVAKGNRDMERKERV